jgi:hypothetical protein
MRGFGTVRHKNTQNVICLLLAQRSHEIILGESRYNFGCGYTYGTRFGHNLTGPPGKLNPVPEWRLKNKIMPDLQPLRI